METAKCLTDTIFNPTTQTLNKMERRKFLKNSAGLAGGMALSGLAINPAEQASRPTDLKITDIRGCMVREYRIVRKTL